MNEMYVIVTELDTLLKCTVKYCRHGRDIAPLLLPNQTSNVYMTKNVEQLLHTVLKKTYIPVDRAYCTTWIKHNYRLQSLMPLLFL
jgi:hypothetical protein